MILDPLTLAFAAGAIVVGAFLQRVSGMGVGLVVSPALGFLIGPQVGIFATNIVTIVSAATLTVVRWRDIDWRRVAWILVAGIPGAFAGALLVRETPTAWLHIILGGSVFLALIVTFAARNLCERDGRSQLVVAGSLGGMLNCAAGVAGPVMAIYARRARWTHPSFGASLQPIFLGLGILSVVSKTMLNSIGGSGELPEWWYIPIVIALVFAGALAGKWASRRIAPAQAQIVSTVLAGTGALMVLARGILGLAA